MATDPDVHPGVEPSVSAAGERLHGGHAGRYKVKKQILCLGQRS